MEIYSATSLKNPSSNSSKVYQSISLRGKILCKSFQRLIENFFQDYFGNFLSTFFKIFQEQQTWKYYWNLIPERTSEEKLTFSEHFLKKKHLRGKSRDKYPGELLEVHCWRNFWSNALGDISEETKISVPERNHGSEWDQYYRTYIIINQSSSNVCS